MKKWAKKYVWVWTLLLILIDQISKFWAINLEGQGINIIQDFFVLRFHINYGIAFGIPVPTLLLIILTVLFLYFGTRYAFKYFDFEKKLTLVSVSLIMGGALSNLIDRVFRNGGVIDFISVWEWPVFNFADSFIVVGVFLLAIFYDKIERG